MNQRIPAALIPKLECYLSSMDQRLPSFLNAFYMVGSIALEEFNPHFSDVDVVAVINHPATKQEMETLREIHHEIERQYPRWKLSGMYLLENELGKYVGEVGNVIGFHDGVLRADKKFEANPVTWWILKNHGIALLGHDPGALPIAVDSKTLVIWTQENMNTYWKSWTRRPIRLLALLTDWGIQWTVLGVLRQFYTIRENKITTKQRAGEYGLVTVPGRWHRLILEAIRIRTKGVDSLYRLRILRMLDTFHFMNYIIQTSNDCLKDPIKSYSSRIRT